MPPIDELLLAEARQARAALGHAEASATVARVRLQRAVRRLHQAGASLREIARSVGLGHDGVRQLIEGAEPTCSFCGAVTTGGRRPIAGPGVWICPSCVDESTGLRGGPSPPGHQPPAPVPDAAAALCSFCGKRRSQVVHMVEGHLPGDALPKKRKHGRGQPARICDECLELCREIHREETGG